MKKLLLVLLLAFPLIGLTQDLPALSNMPIDSVSNLISYKAIIKIPKATQDQLYSKIRAWLANIYNSANNVLQMDDKESGTLIAKGVFGYQIGIYPTRINYILTVNIKPEKFRINITNYTLQVVGGDEKSQLENLYRNMKHPETVKKTGFDTDFINMLNDIDYKSSSILKSLNNYMADNKKDDF